MKNTYPIVRIDRFTMQEILPLVMQKGIFTNYLSLPIKEELLETEKKRMGVTELTPQLKREILTRVGQYRTQNLVVRDYGDYAIAFNLGSYKNFIGGFEDQATISDNSLFQQTTEKVKLYKLGHRLLLIILSKVYERSKFTQLEITKQEILDWLGYKPTEKNIYSDIREALFSLTWLNYQIFRYRSRTKLDNSFNAYGNFIYNVIEDSKGYIIDVNENFVGCISKLFIDRSDNVGEKFTRTYFQFPTAIIPATRKYSTAAYLLTNYLISEEGNNRLNDGDYKIVAFNTRRFMLVMNIKSSRASKRKEEFIRALREVEIISEVSPTLGNLTNLTPSVLEETVVYIKVRREIKELDSYIKSNLLGAKCG